ncbi:hypothetical protein D9599_28830 [Roseomonas sp. KE2513]|nr:hypothetical protein [Roseomonas sp. KE2513]
MELTTLNGLPLVVTGPPDGPMQRMLVAAQAQAQQALTPLAQVDTAIVGRQLVLAGVQPMVEVAAAVKAELETGTRRPCRSAISACSASSHAPGAAQVRTPSRTLRGTCATASPSGGGGKLAPCHGAPRWALRHGGQTLTGSLEKNEPRLHSAGQRSGREAYVRLAGAVPRKRPLGTRDRALLLVGFGAALRRSELAGLALSDAVPVAGRGLQILVRRSKTDQRGAGQEVAVWANPKEAGFCPLAAIEAWLVFRGKGLDITGGASDGERPLFVGKSKGGRLTGQELSDRAVWRLVKGTAEAAGLEGWERFSGHSLRAGLATAAGEAGADLGQVMRQTRHRSADVALGYLRPADLWRNSPTQGVWGEPGDAEQPPVSRTHRWQP